MVKAGWLRQSTNIAKPPQLAQTGRLFKKTNFLSNTTPAFGHPSSAEEGSFAPWSGKYVVAKIERVWPRFSVLFFSVPLGPE